MKSCHHKNALLNVINDKVYSFEEPLATHCGTRHYRPVPVFNFLKLQHIFDLLTVQSAVDILLVAENHQSSASQLFLSEEFGKFVPAIFESQFVP